MGSIRAFICSQAFNTAAPYISELAEAAVGDALGTCKDQNINLDKMKVQGQVMGYSFRILTDLTGNKI